jgi:predicted CoA-substrate-specific enzyme activase
MYTLGVDIGSASSKAVILKDGLGMVAKMAVQLGTGTSGPQKAYEGVFEKCGLSKKDIARTIVTGYGRLSFEHAVTQISEISCHAKGVHSLLPQARTIIDIGGQDSKVLKLNDSGRLVNFVMNDKCAAGTGRFLEVMARVLGVELSQLGELSDNSTVQIEISSVCTVFAESEVISRLSAKTAVADVVAGIHASIASRVSGLVKRGGLQQQVVMTGGVAQNHGVIRAMERKLGVPIIACPECQLTGALGAALFAWEEQRSAMA